MGRTEEQSRVGFVSGRVVLRACWLLCVVLVYDMVCGCVCVCVVVGYLLFVCGVLSMCFVVCVMRYLF